MKTKSTPHLLGRLILAAWTCTFGLPALATVSTRGVASSSGEFITVQIYADITAPAVVSFSSRLFYDPALLELQSATKNEAVWYFHDGTTRVPYVDPDSSQPGAVLFVGSRLDAANPTEGVVGNGILLGSVRFRRLSTETPTFSLTLGHAGSYASFVTVNGVVLDALPGEVSWKGVAPTAADKDLDGLADDWEEKYFNDFGQSYYADDPDGDGVNNNGEEALGSDPNDPASNLRLTLQHPPKEWVLEWTSFAGRIYTVEASMDMEDWEEVLTGVAAEPPLNRVVFEESANLPAVFVRIRLDDPAGP